MRSSTTTIVFASALLAVAPSALAQYSSNPALPETVCATSGDDVQTKLAPAPNGGQFLSYFSGSGYDVYVSRLDANGNVLWSTMVEDRTFSSTTDYGMASDSNGNAYVCYNALDPVSGNAQFKVSSVNSSGALRWSTAIYTYSSNSYASLGNGRCTVASDGFVWGAGSVGFDSTISRLDPTTGAVSFSNYLTESGAKQICSGLQPSTGGTVLLSTVRYTTTYSNKILRIRKINTDGTYAWGGTAGTAAATTGNIQTGNFPDFISDGAGGAYLSWYTTNPLNCRVQHCDAGGTMTFGTDGTLVAQSTTGIFGGTSATCNRTNPVAVLGADGRVYEYFRAYSASIAGIVWYGIGAQCIDSTGAAQWGTDGVMVEDYAPASANVMYDRQTGAAIRLGSGVGIAYTNYASAVNCAGVAAKMNADGTVAWKSTFASEATTKYRFSASASAFTNGSILAWQANAGGSSDVFAARVNADGTVGNPVCTGDLNGDHAVDGADLGILLAAWGTCTNLPCVGDLNLDGVVDGADLGILLAAWGACPQ
jgi:hypothetical protein